MKSAYIFLLSFLFFSQSNNLFGMHNNTIIEKQEFLGNKIRITLKPQDALTFKVTLETELRITIAMFLLSIRIEGISTTGAVSNITIENHFLNKEIERFIVLYATTFFEKHQCSSITITIKKNNSALSGFHTWRSELGLTYEQGPLYTVFSKSLISPLEASLLDLFT